GAAGARSVDREISVIGTHVSKHRWRQRPFKDDLHGGLPSLGDVFGRNRDDLPRPHTDERRRLAIEQNLDAGKDSRKFAGWCEGQFLEIVWRKALSGDQGNLRRGHRTISAPECIAHRPYSEWTLRLHLDLGYGSVATRGASDVNVAK